MDVGQVRALACEGGGTRGIAYGPVLERLEELGVLGRLTDVAGTSAGAITAMLLACGASAADVRRIIETTPWKSLCPARPWSPWAWGRLIRTHGLQRPEHVRGWLGRLLWQLNGSAGVTFDELAADTGRRLYVVASPVDRREGARVFSPSATPSVRVLDAVYASMAVPVVWPPARIGGLRYVDGGLVANHPLGVLPAELQPAEILGIRVDSPDEVSGEMQPYRGVVGLLARVMGLAMRAANRAHVPEELWERVLRIVTDRPALDFNLSQSDLQELRAAGGSAASTLTAT